MTQGGPAGVKPKVEGEALAPASPLSSGASEETQETITTSYAPSRTVRSTDRGGPRVTRLSVGLVVDKTQESQLARIEELVKRAVGFDPSRNDSITTVAHEFPAQASEPVAEESPVAALAPMLLERGIQLLGILGALFLVLKVLKLVTSAAQGKSAAQEAAEKAAAAEKEAAEKAAAEAAAKAAEEPDDETLHDPHELQELVRTTVEGNRSTATRVLRQWLSEGSAN
jgi:flagellar M-ring protein FliF